MKTLNMQRLKLNTCNEKETTTGQWGKNAYGTH